MSDGPILSCARWPGAEPVRLTVKPPASFALVAEADVPHEAGEVEEVLLDDAAVVLAGDGAEVDLEGLPGGRDVLAVGALHGSGQGAGEAGGPTGPLAVGQDHLVGPVVEG